MTMPGKTQPFEQDRLAWVCAPDVFWTVQSAGVLVLNARTGVSAELRYPEAAVWDLLMRGRDRMRMVRILSVVAGLTTPSARREIERCIAQWQLSGWIVQSTDLRKAAPRDLSRETPDLKAQESNHSANTRVYHRKAASKFRGEG